MASEKDLLELLRALPDQSFENEYDLIQKVIPTLVQVLGYCEFETFYGQSRSWVLDGPRLRPDVVLSGSVAAKPWVVIEVKRSKVADVVQWIDQLKRYLAAFDCSVGVVLSPERLVLFARNQVTSYDLRSVSPAEVLEIRKVIHRSAQADIPKAKVSSRPKVFSNARPEGDFIGLIEAVEQADTNAEKGKALEALARRLLECVPSLKCKYKNLQTRSSEIDLVIEYDRTKGAMSLFEDVGRYCLIECKNWSKPVGVNPVRDFIGKLDKCKVKLGIIFSKNGITGVDSGADAVREIQSKFDRDGIYLLVFSLEDLKNIKSGTDFITALDLRADSLRFDADGCEC